MNPSSISLTRSPQRSSINLSSSNTLPSVYHLFKYDRIKNPSLPLQTRLQQPLNGRQLLPPWWQRHIYIGRKAIPLWAGLSGIGAILLSSLAGIFLAVASRRMNPPVALKALAEAKVAKTMTQAVEQKEESLLRKTENIAIKASGGGGRIEGGQSIPPIAPKEDLEIPSVPSIPPKEYSKIPIRNRDINAKLPEEFQIDLNSEVWTSKDYQDIYLFQKGLLELHQAKNWDETAKALEKTLWSTGLNSNGSCVNISSTHANRLITGRLLYRVEYDDPVAGIRGGEVVFIPGSLYGKGNHSKFLESFNINREGMKQTQNYREIEEKLRKSGNGSIALIYHKDPLIRESHATLAVNIKEQIFHIDNWMDKSADVSIMPTFAKRFYEGLLKQPQIDLRDMTFHYGILDSKVHPWLCKIPDRMGTSSTAISSQELETEQVWQAIRQKHGLADYQAAEKAVLEAKTPVELMTTLEKYPLLPGEAHRLFQNYAKESGRDPVLAKAALEWAGQFTHLHDSPLLISSPIGLLEKLSDTNKNIKTPDDLRQMLSRLGFLEQDSPDSWRSSPEFIQLLNRELKNGKTQFIPLYEKCIVGPLHRCYPCWIDSAFLDYGEKLSEKIGRYIRSRLSIPEPSEKSARSVFYQTFFLDPTVQQHPSFSKSRSDIISDIAWRFSDTQPHAKQEKINGIQNIMQALQRLAVLQDGYRQQDYQNLLEFFKEFWLSYRPPIHEAVDQLLNGTYLGEIGYQPEELLPEIQKRYAQNPTNQDLKKLHDDINRKAQRATTTRSPAS